MFNWKQLWCRILYILYLSSPKYWVLINYYSKLNLKQISSFSFSPQNIKIINSLQFHFRFSILNLMHTKYVKFLSAALFPAHYNKDQCYTFLVTRCISVSFRLYEIISYSGMCLKVQFLITKIVWLLNSLCIFPIDFCFGF